MPPKIDQEDFKLYQIRKSPSQSRKRKRLRSECNYNMALYDSDFDGIRFHVQLETLSEYCK